MDDNAVKDYVIKIHKTLKKQGWDNRIGIGNRMRGIIGLRKSYLESKETLHIMKRMDKQSFVSHIQDWGILPLMGIVAKKWEEAYIPNFVDKLEKLDKQLLNTLENI